MSRKEFAVAPLNEQNLLQVPSMGPGTRTALISPIPQRSPSTALKMLNNFQRPAQNFGGQSPTAQEEIASILRRSSSTNNGFHPRMLLVMSSQSVNELDQTPPMSPAPGAGGILPPEALAFRRMSSPPPRGSNPMVNDAVFTSVSQNVTPSVGAGAGRHVAADLSLLRLSPMSCM